MNLIDSNYSHFFKLNTYCSLMHMNRKKNIQKLYINTDIKFQNFHLSKN